MLEFDNATSSYIRYSHLTELDGVSKFAVGWWMFIAGTAAPSAYGRYFSHTDYPTEVNGFQLAMNAGNARQFIAQVMNADGTPSHTWNAPGVAGDTWYHYVLQYDGTEATATDRVRLYVSNTLVTPSSSAGTFPTTVGSHSDMFAVGSNPDLGNYTAMRIHDMAIWSGVVLTSTQRAQLVSRISPLAISPQNLVFYAPMIRGANDVVGGRVGTTNNLVVQPHRSTRYPRMRQTPFGEAAVITPGDGVNVIMF